MEKAQVRSVQTARREAIQALCAVPTAALLASCAALFRRDVVPVCPTSPEVSSPTGALTIDVHCHVFNGTDLQVEKFMSMIAVRQGGALGAGAKLLGSILQGLAWSFAPSGDAEIEVLRELAAALPNCSDGEHTVRIAKLRQAGYTRGREQLQVALARSAVFGTLREQRRLNTVDLTIDDESRRQLAAMQFIDELPQDVEQYRSMRSDGGSNLFAFKDRSFEGLIAFVLQNFQYRYVSVHDYLRTYNQSGGRVVDLMLPSMVDYDYWLAKGEATDTSLRTQVEVMRQISILTGGRVHGFVPFDPLRQVAYELQMTGQDAFALATDAVERHGCIGVKLYPPMGFAPLGNRDLRRADGLPFWDRPWLPKWTSRPDLGARLDDAMINILGWCERKNVPVMAHTSLSNGVTQEFEDLAGSSYWKAALTAFPKLRVNFGHFGDSSPVEDRAAHARGFTALMSADAAAPGAFAYADSGYFVEVLAKEPALRDQLRALYDETAPKQRAALANRFMYGTDWEMTLTEGNVATYLKDFMGLLEELEQRPAIQQQKLSGLSLKFFGVNAVDWIGLRSGGAARARLEAFYAASNVKPPDWVQKVDALS